MRVDHVVPIADKPGRLMFSGRAYSRMRLDRIKRQWERAWYLTHDDAMADRACHGDIRVDDIVVSSGDGPPQRSRRI